MVSVVEATASLAIEIIILALLTAAYMLKNRNKFRQHGILMTTSVILHLITILFVMIPSFSFFFGGSGTLVIDAIVIISLVHVVLGLVAVTIGIWLVGSWHFKTDLQRCFSNKKLMKPTLIIWVSANLLGIYLYILFWANIWANILQP